MGELATVSNSYSSQLPSHFRLLATELTQGETLAAVISASFLDTAGKVETLFLATLNRTPSEAERAQFVDYVEQGGAKHDQGAALADVFWALLNSAEFVLVH